MAGGGINVSPGGAGVPWWTTPGQAAADQDNYGTLGRLQKEAPPGYQLNPITGSYERTPTQAGQNVNQFINSAFPGTTQALTGLVNAGTGAIQGGGVSGGVTATGGMGSGVAGGGSVAGGTGGFSTGNAIGHVSPPDMTAANAAAYGTAKDQVGQSSKAALQSLNDIMGSTGMLGSGAAVQGARDVINAGQAQLGQTSRDTASKMADLASQFAQLGYQGDITQRGQNIQSQEAAAQLAAQQNEAAARLALERQGQLLGLISPAISGLTSLGASGSNPLY